VTDRFTALRPLFDDAPVVLAVLFGSVARGSERADSDVDIGIVPSRPLTLREQLDLGVALERALGREVDLVLLDRDASSLLCLEAAKGRPIFERHATAWSDFVTRALMTHDDVRPHLRRAARRGAETA
jgi:predicted nucleotidyltransferase